MGRLYCAQVMFIQYVCISSTFKADFKKTILHQRKQSISTTVQLGVTMDQQSPPLPRSLWVSELRKEVGEGKPHARSEGAWKKHRTDHGAIQGYLSEKHIYQWRIRSSQCRYIGHKFISYWILTLSLVKDSSCQLPLFLLHSQLYGWDYRLLTIKTIHLR